MQELLSDLAPKRLLEIGIDFAPKILAAILVLLAFWLAYRLTRRPLSAVMRKAKINEKLVDLLVNSIYRYTLLIVGLVMGASQLGINVGAALAGLGVAGIAVGFAAQDSLANLIAGILIFWDKPFVVGDFIDAEGQYGRVSDITLRSTRIRTPQNKFVVIPNKRIIDTVLVNHTKNGELRVDVAVGIAYKEDIPKAREAILAAAAEMGGLRDEPAPSVVVDGLGDSSVDLKVRVWIDRAADERATSYTLTETAKLALDRAGIEIPFPHLQLFVDEVAEKAVDQLGRLPGLTRHSSPSADA